MPYMAFVLLSCTHMRYAIKYCNLWFYISIDISLLRINIKNYLLEGEGTCISLRRNTIENKLPPPYNGLSFEARKEFACCNISYGWAENIFCRNSKRFN